MCSSVYIKLKCFAQGTTLVNLSVELPGPGEQQDEEKHD